MMTLEDFKTARNVLKGVINETHLIHSPALSKASGNSVYLKPENMQVTGAYKIRGAYYTISTLSEEQKSRGLVTASAGNHAQGVAYAAQKAGVPATICMPTTTPLVKVNNTKDYGANVILHGAVFDDAAELASQLAQAEGYTYIHPFNDPILATGQGTIAYEIFSDLPEVDIILVPVGGGGLAAGLGSGLYDVLFGGYDIIQGLITFVSKFLMAAICAWIAGTHKGKLNHLRVVVAAVIGALSYVLLYMLKTFVYQRFVYGYPMETTWATMLSKLPASVINAAVGIVVSLVLFFAMSPALKKAGLLEKLEK